MKNQKINPIRQELLTKRVEVIGHYPGSPFKIGDVLERIYTLTFEGVGVYVYSKSLENIDLLKAINEKEVEKSPAIFRKLNWWEKRNVEDMPEYVKTISVEDFACDRVYWLKDGSDETKFAMRLEGSGYVFNPSFSNLLPATKEEYEAFKKQSEI